MTATQHGAYVCNECGAVRSGAVRTHRGGGSSSVSATADEQRGTCCQGCARAALSALALKATSGRSCQIPYTSKVSWTSCAHSSPSRLMSPRSASYDRRAHPAAPGFGSGRCAASATFGEPHNAPAQAADCHHALPNEVEVGMAELQPGLVIPAGLIAVDVAPGVDRNLGRQ